ncbi:hypothetical protein VXS72_05690 [Acinetobacter pittii]|uniref:hypothetical protein n=1 Tax=Acinetobacter pittii TaxID=48296 RepID=UPI002A07D6B2|nr:hypothetical protein [Acinetobacter pittii]MDX8161873.1 hypothetical protein [Acinetobacter pittii]MEC6391419.1 hypothetical protein [Acinetobacter pittii]
MNLNNHYSQSNYNSNPAILEEILNKDFSVEAINKYFEVHEENFSSDGFEGKILLKIKEDLWLESSLIDDEIDRIDAASMTNINVGVNANVAASINMLAVMNIGIAVNMSIY